MADEPDRAPIPYVGLRNAEHIGRSIRDARRRAGLTQAEVAHMARVSREVVSQVERGRRLPRADTLVSVLDALGLSLAFLPRPAWPPDTAP